MRKVKIILVLSVVIILQGCCTLFNVGCPDLTSNATGQFYYYDFEIDGIDRRAKIYVPSNVETKKPVLFYFHGYSGDAEDSDNRRQFQTIWSDAIIVYAEGISPYNANSPLKGWKIRFPYINKQCGEDDDLKYIDQIMVELRSKYLIDDERIFASGHSSGAFFTLALMELKADLFKGFAPLGAYSRFKVNTSNLNCNPLNWTSAPPLELNSNEVASIPRPVLYMFGVLENFDYDGPIQLRSFSTSCLEDSLFRNTVDELLIRNGIDIPDCTNGRTDYIKNTSRQIFTPNGLGAQVQIQLYHGGHGWEDFTNGNQEVVDFFQSL